MKLEYPLNEALPNIEHTRDRLLAKIFHFRKEERDGIASREEDFELLYAYGESHSRIYFPSFFSCCLGRLGLMSMIADKQSCSTCYGPAIEGDYGSGKGD